MKIFFFIFFIYCVTTDGFSQTFSINNTLSRSSSEGSAPLKKSMPFGISNKIIIGLSTVAEQSLHTEGSTVQHHKQDQKISEVKDYSKQRTDETQLQANKTVKDPSKNQSENQIDKNALSQQAVGITSPTTKKATDTIKVVANQPVPQRQKQSEPVVTATPQPEATKTETPKPTIQDNTGKLADKTGEATDRLMKDNLGQEYTGAIPTYYALIIGESEYKYESPNIPGLAFPVKDANRIKKLLVERYAFDAKNVRLLENPPRSAVIDAFEQLSAEVTPKDNVLIFYAGHGFYDKEKGFGYWLPSDARSTSKSDWIPNTIVRDYLGAISAKHTLLISDACFSGSIFRTRGVMEFMATKISEMYKYPSRRAMTSGSLSQVPDKSIFADYLIKRLEDNNDPFLPAQTLFYRIYEPVTNNSPATPQFGVVQSTGDEGGDFIFIKRTKKQ